MYSESLIFATCATIYDSFAETELMGAIKSALRKLIIIINTLKTTALETTLQGLKVGCLALFFSPTSFGQLNIPTRHRRKCKLPRGTRNFLDAVVIKLQRLCFDAKLPRMDWTRATFRELQHHNQRRFSSPHSHETSPSIFNFSPLTPLPLLLRRHCPSLQGSPTLNSHTYIYIYLTLPPLCV